MRTIFNKTFLLRKRSRALRARVYTGCAGLDFVSKKVAFLLVLTGIAFVVKKNLKIEVRVESGARAATSITRPVLEWLDVLTANSPPSKHTMLMVLRAVARIHLLSPSIKHAHADHLLPLSAEIFPDVVKFTVSGSDIELWFNDDRDAVEFSLKYLSGE